MTADPGPEQRVRALVTCLLAADEGLAWSLIADEVEPGDLLFVAATEWAKSLRDVSHLTGEDPVRAWRRRCLLELVEDGGQ
jgi:hypothetical protein